MVRTHRPEAVPRLEAERSQHLGVPAYFRPGSNWDVASRPGTAIRYLVLNPASGPGTAVHTGYAAAVAEAQRAGIAVLGYVDTAHGRRDGALAIHEINRYRDWYGVDGVFLDQSAATSEALAYYERLAAHVRRGPGSVVALNPGVYPWEHYADLADALVTYEGDFATYLNCSVPDWVEGYPRQCFWHLVYATSRAQLGSALGLARKRRAGIVYVTDRRLDNPWDRLASYWGAEIRIVAPQGAHMPQP
jgi:hypothetical protein